MTIENFINGKHTPSHGARIALFEPATGLEYGSLPDSTNEDLEEAVNGARNARANWATMDGVERGNCLRRLADLIEAHAEELIEAEARDNGKTKGLATHVDVPRTLSTLRFFAGAAEHFSSESHLAQNGKIIQYTHRKPVGIVGCIAPWNFPLYLFAWKFAPALAAGNCVIGKPSEWTPATAYLMSHWINEAGFPPGVFNILFGKGPGIGEHIVRHPDIKAISFTGGTVAGRRINELASQQFKKVTLELGGKNALVVFPDANLDAAVGAALRSSFANMGQICFCTSRILVHASIMEAFREKFVGAARAMHVGDPMDPSTTTGAMVSEEHKQRVLQSIQRAVDEGGQVLCGGHAAEAPSERCSGGAFIQPTVIEGLSMDCDTNQNEIFGPVVTLQAFEHESEALALANDSQYGLTASVWSRDIDRCHRFAANLDVGTVWVNCWMVRDNRAPFGGQKSSGIGREGGWEAMRFFTDPVNVCIEIAPDDAS